MISSFRSPALAAVEPGEASASASAARTAVDPLAYKRGMRRLASGVSVIATEHEGARFGLLSTSVTSVSAVPPVLLACIDRAASSHDAFARSGRFCVNVLRQDDLELADRFGSSKDRAARFVGREWTRLATGAPALVGCLASFDCMIVRALPADTHTVFFGSVAEIQLWSEVIDPLVHWDGSYWTSAPMPT